MGAEMRLTLLAFEAPRLYSSAGAVGGMAESASYTYDNYGRLVTSNQMSNGSSAQRRFAYDRWGNRTGMWDSISGGSQIQSISLQTVSFPGTGSAPTNRITSVPGKTTLNYTYDANGNVTSDGLHSYTYDSENRVINVDNGAAVYAYDYQNRRYKKTAGGAVTYYVWEGNQVVREYNGSSGTMTAQYNYVGSRMIAKAANGTTQYFLSDRLSSRLALSDVGAVAGRQGILPFGEDFAESGTQEKHHFTSYERDAESGLDYSVNRSNSPNLGRFQQADPYKASGGLNYPQSWNRYVYSRNDPLNRVDPLGLQDLDSDILWDYCGDGDAFPANLHLQPYPETIPESQKRAPFPQDVRKSLLDMLKSNNGDCGRFAQRLIDQAARDAGSSFSANVEDIIGLITNQGGYVFQQPNVPGVPNAGGTVQGSIATGDARVVIAPVPEPDGTTDSGRLLNQYFYVETALHETLHLASVSGRYSDADLAIAAVHLGGLSDGDLAYFDSLDVGSREQMSGFYDYILSQHCTRP